MKRPRIKRELALLFSLCSLAIIPLVIIVRSRSPITDDKALVDGNYGMGGYGIDAEISPDGSLIAAVEPSNRYRAYTADGFVHDGFDLVVRPLDKSQKTDKAEVKARLWLDWKYQRVNWSADGKSISVWGSEAILYDFAGGATPTTENWNYGTGGTYSRTILPLRPMVEYTKGYSEGPAWILPESDCVIGRNNTGVWGANEISNGRDIPLKITTINPPISLSGSYRVMAPRPLAAPQGNGSLPSIQLSEVVAEPTPTPSPFPTPTAEEARKQAIRGALYNQLTQIDWQANSEQTPDPKKLAELEARIKAIKKQLGPDYPGSPFGYVPGEAPPPPPPQGNPTPPPYANVKLTDAVVGRTFWTHRTPYNMSVPNLLWSSDGSLLALIGNYNKESKASNIRIIDGKSGRTLSDSTAPTVKIDYRHARFFPSGNGQWSLMIPESTAEDSAFRFFDARTGKLTMTWPLSAFRQLKLSPHYWACNQSGEFWAFASAAPGLRDEKSHVVELKWLKITRKELDKRLGVSASKS